jgi:hypothetical protein
MGQYFSNVITSSDNNLETFTLLWLDASINTDDQNRQAQESLRSIFYQLRQFENLDRCEQFIKSTPIEDRIVLIVSGQLGREIVPRIYTLEQLLSVYVYCHDVKSNEEWAVQFSKVIKISCVIEKS